MERLDQIKKEYAIESGSSSWDDMCEYFMIGDVGGIHEAYKAVIKIYTEECIKASLEKVSKAPAFYKLNDKCERIYGIQRDAITDKDNIVLL